MKKIMYLLFATALLGACCNNTKTEGDAKTDAAEVDKCEVMDVDSFLVVAPDMVGKEVTVKGTVDHVCKHGGKRIKIFSSDPKKTLHGSASEETGSFDAEIEGNDVCLIGTVTEYKMELADIEKYEKQVKEEMEKAKTEEHKEEGDEQEHEHEKGEGEGHHHHDQDYTKTLDKIAKWKEELASNDKGYVVVSYYLKDAGLKTCEKKNCEEEK